MKYRVIVDVFCDEQEHGAQFAEHVVKIVNEAFDEWPERKIGLYTHKSYHANPDKAHRTESECVK